MGPGLPELRAVGELLGRVVLATGALQVPALVVATLAGEHNDAAALAVGALLAVIAGQCLQRGRRQGLTVDAGSGMVVVASAWLVVPALVAVPLALSGHADGPIDAYFDAMSGLTTSGLSVLQDLDHLGAGMQVLRHTLHFAGGQGIVLVVLTLLQGGLGGVGLLMSGEGREQRLVPNVMRTARLIYLIASTWLVLGTAVLTVVLLAEGFAPGRAMLHAMLLFMAAFDTGGFSVMSTSVAYYHSGPTQLVLVVLMVAGALSFPVHHHLWRRRVGQVGRDIGVRTYVVTTVLLTMVMLVGVAAHDALDRTWPLLRSVVFTAVSAATGTGFAVVPGSVYDGWGQLAPGALVTLMAIGAMAGSTAGGIKVERIGLLARTVLRDVRRALSPPDAVVLAIRPGTIDGRPVRIDATAASSAALVTLLFVATYVGGAMVAVGFGASVEDALFESVSATATVGLSVGITSPDAAWPVKLVTIVQMWLGRLEFLAVFGFVGWVAALARGPAAGTVARRTLRGRADRPA